MQRSRVRKYIGSAGVFNCRKVVNTNVWSQHAWGNAVDLMPHVPPPDHELEVLQTIAYNAEKQGTKRTIANRGRKVPIETIIYGQRAWVRGEGWHPYDGEYHNHVHVDFNPHKEGVPPCAH